MSSAFFRTASVITFGIIAIMNMGISSSEAAMPPNCIDTYIVEPGDTQSSIADKFDVSVQNLYRWNNGDGIPYIVPGNEICVKVDARL